MSPRPRRVPRQNRSGPALRSRGEGGFTLLGLSIVVFLISVLAAFAVPAWKRAQHESRARAVVHDLRAFSAALQTYAREKGDWPAGDGTPAALPAGMSGALGKPNWQRVTPVGGHYTWAPNSLQQGERYHAAIVLSSTADSAVSADQQQLLEIDRTLDDGDLATGNFRLGYRNFLLFVIEH